MSEQTRCSVAWKEVCHLRMSALGSKHLTNRPVWSASLLASEDPRGTVVFQEYRWQSQSRDEITLPDHLPSARVAGGCSKLILGSCPARQGGWRKTCNWESSVLFYFINTPEAFHKNTRGC